MQRPQLSVSQDRIAIVIDKINAQETLDNSYYNINIKSPLCSTMMS